MTKTDLLNDAHNLLGFIHSDPETWNNEIQLIRGDKVHRTNVDALLNYSNWLSGKIWANIPFGPRQNSIYRCITDRDFELRPGHHFLSHVFTTCLDDQSINIKTRTMGLSKKEYVSETNHFFGHHEYLFMVGMIQSVYNHKPDPSRLHETMHLVIQPSSISLSYPTDKKTEAVTTEFTSDPTDINFAINSEPVGLK